MTVLVKPEAYADLASAFEWYQAIQPELAQRFAAEFDQVLDDLEHFPFRYPPGYHQFRRARLINFPYYLFYRLDAGRLVVISLIHSSRDPRAIRRTLRRRG